MTWPRTMPADPDQPGRRDVRSAVSLWPRVDVLMRAGARDAAVARLPPARAVPAASCRRRRPPRSQERRRAVCVQGVQGRRRGAAGAVLRPAGGGRAQERPTSPRPAARARRRTPARQGRRRLPAALPGRGRTGRRRDYAMVSHPVIPAGAPAPDGPRSVAADGTGRSCRCATRSASRRSAPPTSSAAGEADGAVGGPRAAHRRAARLEAGLQRGAGAGAVAEGHRRRPLIGLLAARSAGVRYRQGWRWDPAVARASTSFVVARRGSWRRACAARGRSGERRAPDERERAERALVGERADGDVRRAGSRSPPPCAAAA